MMVQRDEIPVGWKLASIEDINKHREKANAAVNQTWAICALQDGKIAGRGYKNEVQRGSFNDLGHKLVTNLRSSKLKIRVGIRNKHKLVL